MDQMAREIGDIGPTKAEAAASAACTRSGAFGLALSIVLILLMPSWDHRHNETAFSHYLFYRNQLKVAMDRLNGDSRWQAVRASNAEAAESVTIAALSARGEFVVPPPASPAPKESQSKRHAAPRRPQPPGFRPGVPGAPTGVRGVVTYDVPVIPMMVDALGKLNEPGLLAESEGYSNYYGYSIERWRQRQHDLIMGNWGSGVCSSKQVDTEYIDPVLHRMVPGIDSNALLACLTIKDVQELAQYEQPTMTPDQIGGSVEREIDLSPGMLPRSLNGASLVADLLLVFTIIYFGAFAREAVSAPGFPSAGTLFGAFSRSRFTLTVFLLFLVTPVFSSASLSYASRRFVVELILNTIAVIWVFVGLGRKSYFAPLNPLIWIRRKAPSGQGDPMANAEEKSVDLQERHD